jgi:hypothetical protein
MGFSFRDFSQAEGDQAVYGYTEFTLNETRWQSLQRHGLVANSPTTWVEKPVFYQGKETYPWPGKRHWVDNEALIQYEDNSALFISSEGAADVAGNREKYTNPAVTTIEPKKCQDEYKL